MPRNGRIPVCAGPRCIEFAGPERVRRLLTAPNVTVIRRCKDEAVACILLEEYGDDALLHTRGGNPRKLSHHSETAENPPRVWTFKRIRPLAGE